MRVGEEPDVHHDVGVEREAVLEAEALDRDLELGAARTIEGGDEALLQLVDVELGAVDHQVGGVTDRGEQSALELDRLHEAIGIGGERVPPPRSRVVAADELGRVAVEVEHGDAMVGGTQRSHVVEHLGVIAPGDEGQPVDTAAGLRRQLDDLLDERRREVVDDVPTEVLEHVRRSRPPSPRHAGDQDDIGHRRRLPSGTFAGAEVQQPRHRCCVRVLGARARKPGGGAGSTMCSSVRPWPARALT